MKKRKSVTSEAEQVPWENPLIPNKKLRQIYTAMAEIRLLEEHLARRSRKRSTQRGGEEAILASTVLSLDPGDLTSNPTSAAAIRFLRTAKFDGLASSATRDRSQLPVPPDPVTRLQLALGAALVPARKPAVVVAYLYPDELSSAEWKPLFRIASAYSAPVLFVGLPASTKALKPGKLSEIATASGVPGIPVDAADAVALYRVVQESLLRARAGGGPALMECIPFKLPGSKFVPSDPVQAMRESLLHRKAAEAAWFTAIADRFSSRLDEATF